MQPKPLVLRILDVLSVIVLGIATYLALVFAPKELVMGDVQRVFYFQVAVDENYFLFGNARHTKSSCQQIAALNVKGFLIVFVLKNGSVDMSASAEDADVRIVRHRRGRHTDRRRV